VAEGVIVVDTEYETLTLKLIDALTDEVATTEAADAVINEVTVPNEEEECFRVAFEENETTDAADDDAKEFAERVDVPVADGVINVVCVCVAAAAADATAALAGVEVGVGETEIEAGPVTVDEGVGVDEDEFDATRDEVGVGDGVDDIETTRELVTVDEIERDDAATVTVIPDTFSKE
jgi:hypothetical protein